MRIYYFPRLKEFVQLESPWAAILSTTSSLLINYNFYHIPGMTTLHPGHIFLTAVRWLE
jgi:hypothetical protein